MEFGYISAICFPGLSVFPDFVFNAPPRQPEQIRETTVLKGTNTGTHLQMGGTPDVFPNQQP